MPDTKTAPRERIESAERLWTVRDTSEHTGLPVKTIYAYVAAGSGPVAIRLGKHLRFRRADVEAWLTEREVTRQGDRPGAA